jgi:hypothetical protein
VFVATGAASSRYFLKPRVSSEGGCDVVGRVEGGTFQDTRVHRAHAHRPTWCRHVRIARKHSCSFYTSTKRFRRTTSDYHLCWESLSCMEEATWLAMLQASHHLHRPGLKLLFPPCTYHRSGHRPRHAPLDLLTTFPLHRHRNTTIIALLFRILQCSLQHRTLCEHLLSRDIPIQQ